jgi:outer membrane protein assembly factor BamB
MGDLGRMHPTQMYSRTVAAGMDGRIYIGIGMGEGDIVVFDPETGKHSSILPADMVGIKSGSTRTGEDGHAYAQLGEQWYRCEDSTLFPVPGYPGPPIQRFRDGRILESAGNGFYEIRHPDGRVARSEFSYEGTGVGIFMVANGPLGRIYGSTMMPLELFEYDPIGGTMKHLGNPTSVNGEIYSMVVLDDLLYVCAYPGSWLSVYDPNRPWNYGTTAESNPRGIGYAGDGHLRPRAMIAAPDGRIYIGSHPPYGEHGGALGVYDPVDDSFVENYRHLVPNQGIVTLAYEPDCALIFGGSSTAGGGGTRPLERSAHLFAWDPVKQEKVLDVVPDADDDKINAMTVMDGHLFFATRPSNSIYCLEPGDTTPSFISRVPDGVLDLSLGIHGTTIIGLSSRGVIELDPETRDLKTLGTFSQSIGCGFALGPTGLYFGSGSRLGRFAW